MLKLTIIAALIVVSVFAASGASARNVKPPKLIGDLTLGVGIDASYAPFVIATEQHFMQKNGLAAHLKIFPSGQESLEAVLTGQADSTGNGQYNIPLVAAKGGNTKIIAQYETSNKQFGVVASRDVTKPQDLIGKTVATQVGTSPEYYYHLYTKHYGLDESKIKLVNLTFAQMVPALARGDISAFFAFEPYLTQATTDVPGAHVLGRSGDEGIMPLRVYLGVSQKVYSNKRIAEAFLRALIEAGQWAQAHQTQAAAELSKSFNIPQADAERYVSYFNYANVNLSCASLNALDNVNSYLVSQHILTQAADLSQFVDSSFLRAIAPKRTCGKAKG
jgi:ABC-type nitrate/sulfonate/bicarbonate transport system substrate-binding protein